jgi:hypothetical protein
LATRPRGRGARGRNRHGGRRPLRRVAWIPDSTARALAVWRRDDGLDRKWRSGQGGRNTEFLLALSLALAGAENTWAIAGDSDGIDGTEDAAGAVVAPDTLVRARGAGLDARGFLSAHDSYTFFDRLGDLVRTGPTLTNVNDIRALLVAPMTRR